METAPLASKLVLPTFLVIGAAKSGTTSLFYYLKQHPEVYTSHRKCTRYFNVGLHETPPCGPGDQRRMERWIGTIEEYARLFEGGTNFKAIGEVSPTYLYYPGAAKQIREVVPKARLMAILRDPADRAFSMYAMRQRRSEEPYQDFRKVIRDEARRIQKNWSHNWHYVQMGMYASQIDRYDALFPREQLRIFLFDDLLADAHGLMRDMFEFIGVDPSFRAELEKKHNEGYGVRNPRLNRLVWHQGAWKQRMRGLVPRSLRTLLVERINRANRVAKPKLEMDARAELIEVYRNEILRLQDRIGRDLTSWLTVDRKAAKA